MTDKGWEHRRLPDVTASLNVRADTLFRPLLRDPNDIVDVSQDSMLGRFIQLLSPEFASLWEAGLDSYSGLDVDQAYGKGLDALVEYAAVTRREAVKSTLDLEVGGLLGTTIPARSYVRDLVTGITWYMPRVTELTLEDATEITYKITSYQDSKQYSILASMVNESLTFSYTSVAGNTEVDVYNGLKDSVESQTNKIIAVVDGSSDNPTLTLSLANKREDLFWTIYEGYAVRVKKLTQAEAEQSGAVVAQIDNIRGIESSVLGWETVNNPFPTFVGYNRETDAELRKRFKDSKSSRSEGYADSLFSRISELSGIRQVVVYENYTDVTDSNGLPEKSFLIVVLGGDDQEIARQIRITRPIGISSKGNTEISFQDSQGVTVSERFERPEQVEVFFKVRFSKIGSVEFGVENKIKNLIVDYINTQKTIGETLRYDELFIPLMQVKGITYKLVNFGLSDSALGYDEITPTFNSIVFTKNVNIEVEEVV